MIPSTMNSHGQGFRRPGEYGQHPGGPGFYPPNQGGMNQGPGSPMKRDIN